MEEKKLTDEEIVKALEHCYHNRSCEYCYHNDENGSGEIVCRSRLMEKALDLIHRLQDENKQLKSNKFASWKLKFFNLKDELKKELSEHEEFTQKAKAEIERLTEERDMYADDLYWKAEVRKREDFITELTVENAELQKQVDELKKPINGKFKDNNALNKAYKSLEKEFTKGSQRLRELQNKENKEQVIECYGILKGCDMVKQAVKDAAREIFTELLKEFSKRKSCGNADVVVREMASRKGVEVE